MLDKNIIENFKGMSNELIMIGAKLITKYFVYNIGTDTQSKECSTFLNNYINSITQKMLYYDIESDLIFPLCKTEFSINKDINEIGVIITSDDNPIGSSSEFIIANINWLIQVFGLQRMSNLSKNFTSNNEKIVLYTTLLCMKILFGQIILSFLILKLNPPEIKCPEDKYLKTLCYTTWWNDIMNDDVLKIPYPSDLITKPNHMILKPNIVITKSNMICISDIQLNWEFDEKG